MVTRLAAVSIALIVAPRVDVQLWQGMEFHPKSLEVSGPRVPGTTQKSSAQVVERPSLARTTTCMGTAVGLNSSVCDALVTADRVLWKPGRQEDHVWQELGWYQKRIDGGVTANRRMGKRGLKPLGNLLKESAELHRHGSLRGWFACGNLMPNRKTVLDGDVVRGDG